MISPEVSVVMPVFNCQRYLPEAIESIIRQTFTNFEFIIVDDGSTDETPLILNNYANRDKRIRLIRLSHTASPACPSNVGIQHARGQFIARMDGDDIAYPYRFERQLAYMHSSDECVAASGKVLFIDEEGFPLMLSQQKLDHYQIEEELFKGRGLALVHSAAMFRREALIRVKGYREKYIKGEDLDLYLRLGEIGKLSNLSDVLLKVRRHSSSLTSIGGGEENKIFRTEIITDAMIRRGISPETIKLFEFRQPKSVGEYHLELAYLAINGGYNNTARKHIMKALRYKILSKRSLKALCLSMMLTIPGIRAAYRYYKNM
jgi:glycosyltransferase involved in cell wall biosynthesis